MDVSARPYAHWVWDCLYLTLTNNYGQLSVILLVNDWLVLFALFVSFKGWRNVFQSKGDDFEIISVIPTDDLVSRERSTNCYFCLAPSTIITFLAHRYRFVFILDISPSLASLVSNRYCILWILVLWLIFEIFFNSVRGISFQLAWILLSFIYCKLL